MFWWFNVVVTPLTIPNRVVKRHSADGTRKGRVGIRQNKALNKSFYFCYNQFMISWSARRRLLYLLAAVLLIVAVLAIILIYYRPQPSCFDGIQNQAELGIDCGGPCALVCELEVQAPKVIWTRIFKVSADRYDAATLIENPNRGHSLASLKYFLRVLDDDNILITLREGEVFLNPGERFIVFDHRLAVGSRLPARAIFVPGEPEPPVWQRVDKESPKLAIARQSFTNLPSPRLVAVVRNDSFVDLANIQIVVALSNQEYNAIGISSTLIENLGRGEAREIAYTWPEPFADEPVLFDFYPHFDLRQVP